MISYGLRVLGGLAVAIVGILVLASTTDRMLGAGNATQVTSTTGIEINRTNKGDRTPRNLRPDSSHSHNPDGFPMKFNAFITLAIPLARFDAIMRLRNIARN